MTSLERPRSGAAWLADACAWADAQLSTFAPPADAHPAHLFAALHHALFAGGKRLRPALVLALCEGLGGAREAAARAAAAVEFAHTYSLVHDDLPAMDDDDLRRGRPTVHVAWDEATAILVGDGLQALAFETLAGDAQGAALVGVLARGIGVDGMVGGQALDLKRASRRPGPEGIVEVHAKKTAALFGACAEMGAICAGADAGRRAAAQRFGRELGLAFQAVDDVLDVTGAAADLGKTPGKDAARGRDSLVGHLGLDGARAAAATHSAAAEAALAELELEVPGPAAAIVERVLARSS